MGFRFPPLSALLLAGFAACACERARTSTAASALATASAAPRASARSEATERPKPIRTRDATVLLTLPSSAYRASLTADGDAAYLLTSDAAHRLAPGSAAEAQSAALGFGATATAGALLFWSEGAVRELSKRDGTIRRLVGLATRPQVLVSSGNDVGWIERSESGRFSLGSSATQPASRVYTSPGKIDAAVMLSDWLFFVERPAEGAWRVGGVRTSGGTPEFTSPRAGRAPSMLAARHELYYYDGNRREVRRLSPDLRNEETLATDFVCSPLAVAEQVYCANVQGIFELAPGARPRPLVELSAGRFVTDLAATASHLYWLADAGPDRLQVSAISLGD